jgi:hypothetical protein
MARFVLPWRRRMRPGVSAFFFCATTALPAQAVDLPGGIQLNGAVDVYVDVNFNGPPDHGNFLPGTGTTAKRANEFSVNLVSLELQKTPEPVGFHLWLVAGTGTEVEHESEIVGPGTGPQVWRYVQQASVSARIPVGRGLEIEGGIYPSHIGFEGFASQTDWNYTRSWMADYSPYYQTGIKATYVFDDAWSAQIQVLNGWQRIGDNNNGKSLGTQIVWKAGASTLTFNTFLGPELTDDDHDWRYFVDFVWTLQIGLANQVALTLDLGLQQEPQAPADTWWGAAAYYRRQLSPRWAATVRAEVYRDPEGVMSGTPQTLVEGTLTVEFRPWQILLLKLEGRYDHSTAHVFGASPKLASGLPSKVQDQVLIVLGAVAAF